MNEDVLYAIEHGIIDMTCLIETVKQRKRKDVIDKHTQHYSIWQGRTNRCWYTHLLDENGKLKKVKRKEYSGLEEAIFNYYQGREYNPTIEELFLEWIERKVTKENLLPQTRDRYKRQYKQLIGDFGERRVRTVTELDIENLVINRINEHHLTAKATANLRTLLKGIFRLARKKGLVTFGITSVLEDLDISRTAYAKNYKVDEELVFSNEEFQAIYQYVMDNQDNPRALGILLVFFTGLRPGELAALRWEDIRGKYIHVQNMEEKFEESGKVICQVRPRPKTEASIRTIPIPDCAKWIIDLRRLYPSNEGYVFEADGKRLTIASFDNYFRRMLRKINVPQKSLSKIRKTYSTILMDAKLEDGVVTKLMGHTDITTTRRHYYKNRNNEEQMHEKVNKVFLIGPQNLHYV